MSPNECRDDCISHTAALCESMIITIIRDAAMSSEVILYTIYWFSYPAHSTLLEHCQVVSTHSLCFRVPYLALSKTFEQIEAISGR